MGSDERARVTHFRSQGIAVRVNYNTTIRATAIEFSSTVITKRFLVARISVLALGGGEESQLVYDWVAPSLVPRELTRRGALIVHQLVELFAYSKLTCLVKFLLRGVLLAFGPRFRGSSPINDGKHSGRRGKGVIATECGGSATRDRGNLITASSLEIRMGLGRVDEGWSKIGGLATTDSGIVILYEGPISTIP